MAFCPENSSSRVDITKGLNDLLLEGEDSTKNTEKVEVEDTPSPKREETLDSKKKVRHCAFCLNSVADEAIKLCSKCHKRAYCSPECEAADWKPNGEGQGHKNWCHLGCGEEDLDWEVSPVPGKGFGLIAKRMLPAKFRIIVDACRQKDHPAIKDLMPVDGTYAEKFHLNCLGSGESAESVLCLRISRANHQCGANADHVYDEHFKVKILFAAKDIQKGEEICINYQSYNDISNNVSAEQARSVLNLKWGIVCPKDCFCYDGEIEKIITKSKKLDSLIFSLASQGTAEFVNAALDTVKELLKNHEIINSSWHNTKRTLYDGFQIAIMRKKTLKQAEDLMQKLYDTDSCILSPDSPEVLKYKGFIKRPNFHRNYLILG